MSALTQYEVKHVSTYRYAERARECVMMLCLQPRQDRGQRLARFEVATQPLACFNPDTDCFGNARHVLNIH
ncbi:MAG: transglutaminase N-terminal domain-containing protein, partial [bacterium]